MARVLCTLACVVASTLFLSFAGSAYASDDAPPEFKLSDELTLPAFPHSLRVGQFDGDGAADLAVELGVDDAAVGHVATLAGAGDGTFSEGPVARPDFGGGGGHPSAFEIADVNADGRPDAIIATVGRSQDPRDQAAVSVHLRKRNGDFRSKPRFYFERVREDAGHNEGASDLEVADFDGDGRPDFAVLNDSRNVITVRRGRGDGRFVRPKETRVATGSRELAFADFDADGLPDLALAGDEGLSILLSNGRRRFADPVAVASAPLGRNEPVAADLDGDGDPDLVQAADPNYAARGSANYTGELITALNRGDGSFETPVMTALPYAAGDVAVGDLDGDDVPDVAVPMRFGNEVAALLGQGGGELAAPVTAYEGEAPIACAIADFDGDGHRDLAVLREPQPGPYPPSKLSVLLNQAP